MASPYSCHLEHLASHNLLGGIEHRMSASIQSLTGLQQNPYLMPRLCSADHHAGRLTGAAVIMGGNVKREHKGGNLLTAQVSVHFSFWGSSLSHSV